MRPRCKKPSVLGSPPGMGFLPADRCQIDLCNLRLPVVVLLILVGRELVRGHAGDQGEHLTPANPAHAISEYIVADVIAPAAGDEGLLNLFKARHGTPEKNRQPRQRAEPN